MEKVDRSLQKLHNIVFKFENYTYQTKFIPDHTKNLKGP